MHGAVNGPLGGHDDDASTIRHNPLQQLSYTFLYLVGLVMIVTGFTLYGQAAPGSVIFRLFAWVIPLLGGIQMVRVVHHVLTWFFIIFVPIHIYLAWRSDIMERSGTITSIVSGGRFVSTSETYVDE